MLVVGSVGQCCSVLAANWGKRAIFLPQDSEPSICDIGRRVKCSLGSPERQTGMDIQCVGSGVGSRYALGTDVALVLAGEEKRKQPFRGR